MGNSVADSECELVRSCLAGEKDGLRAFVEQFQGTVFGLCYHMLRHRQDAEDVAQDVFWRALRNLHRWDQTRPLKPWLLTIAANRCKTLLSTRARIPRAGNFEEDRYQADVPAAQSELAEELQLALQKVREEYRLCFVLYHFQELSLAEISDVVGAPVGTIKTWLLRVRGELAGELHRRGFGLSVKHELP